jgi:hypothetical protein
LPAQVLPRADKKSCGLWRNDEKRIKALGDTAPSASQVESQTGMPPQYLQNLQLLQTQAVSVTAESTCIIDFEMIIFRRHDL